MTNSSPDQIVMGIVAAIILVVVFTPFFAAMYEQGDKIISEDSELKDSWDNTKDTTNLFLNMLTPGTLEFGLLVFSFIGLVLAGFIVKKR